MRAHRGAWSSQFGETKKSRILGFGQFCPPNRAGILAQPKSGTSASGVFASLIKNPSAHPFLAASPRLHACTLRPSSAEAVGTVGAVLSAPKPEPPEKPTLYFALSAHSSPYPIPKYPPDLKRRSGRISDRASHIPDFAGVSTTPPNADPL